MLKSLHHILPPQAADTLRLLAGRCVDDMVTMDGCIFDVNLPQITTRAKSTFLFNRYEASLRRAVTHHISPDLPVIELGAGLGVVSCITNKRLRNPQWHIVVEANPVMIPAIQRQCALNDCSFEIINAAIAYNGGYVNLDSSESYMSTHVNAVRPTQTIRALTLEQIAHTLRTPPPFTLVCDIEGAEIELVKHELDILKTRVTTFVLELHPRLVGQAATDNMLAALRQAGMNRCVFYAQSVSGKVTIGPNVGS